MQRVALLGAVVLALGLAGYAVGVETTYPGRAFSVTAVMLGIALLALGRPEEVAP